MATTTTKEYQISGFHCSGCANKLSNSLARLEGAIKADADYDQAGELRRLRSLAPTLPDIGWNDPCVCHILEEGVHEDGH